MDSAYWILDADKRPVRVASVLEWGQWFASSGQRFVARDKIGDATVSTVFLGIDHQFGGGPPLLFETMIFGGHLDGYQERCTSWQQAEDMHARACALLRGN